MKYKKGEKIIYENIFDGLSYYPTVGETYHLNRAKQKIQKFYLEAVSGVEKPRILDIGCHIGTDLFQLPKVNPNAKFWGIDISSDAISYAKKLAKLRGEKSIYFKVADANKPLPFPESYFDVVLASEVIEHLHYPQQFLKEVRRILKSSGNLIVSTPNDKSIVNKIARFLGIKRLVEASRQMDFQRHGPAFHLQPADWDHSAHISLYGWSEWKKMFEKAGFKVDGIEGSAAYGGSRFIGDHPFLLSLAILADSVIDKIPLKPHLQMCLIAKFSRKK